jgi:hypothetical protein
MPNIPSARQMLKQYYEDHGNKFGYMKDNVTIMGKNKSAKDIGWEQIEILAEELDTVINRDQNPTVAGIIARGAPRILDAVRLVNYETKNGYMGAAARGHELVANPMGVNDCSSATSGATAKTTWLNTITSVGGADYIGTDSYDVQMLVSSLPVLAHVYLGFIDPVEVPKVSRVQLVKNNDAWPQEYIAWLRDTFGNNATPVYELKQPWIIPPGEEYFIPAYYYLTGDDKLQPIGFTVKRATDIIGLLA